MFNLLTTYYLRTRARLKRHGRPAGWIVRWRQLCRYKTACSVLGTWFSLRAQTRRRACFEATGLDHHHIFTKCTDNMWTSPKSWSLIRERESDHRAQCWNHRRQRQSASSAFTMWLCVCMCVLKRELELMLDPLRLQNKLDRLDPYATVKHTHSHNYTMKSHHTAYTRSHCAI